jgi:transposase-like protein
MLADHRHEYPSEWAAMSSIASKFGMTPETLRSWVRRGQIDGGQRPGLTTDKRQRMRALEREVRELRRANEILKAASIFMSNPRLCVAGPGRGQSPLVRGVEGR